VNWELIREAPRSVVVAHVVDEYDKIADRVGVLERALQLAVEPEQEGPPPDADENERTDFWIQRAVLELAA
jgi:hypothetical protein